VFKTTFFSNCHHEGIPFTRLGVTLVAERAYDSLRGSRLDSTFCGTHTSGLAALPTKHNALNNVT